MVSVTETCRDIDELAKPAQHAIRLFFQECYKQGIAIFVTETYRSQERQAYLYQQGRTRPGNIVTWTLNSYHKSRLAWDIGASQLNGNSNIYNTTIIKKAGAIAGKLGITWGGTWTKNLDYPHFEVKSNWTIPKGYKLEGKISIPTRSTNKIVIVDSINKLPPVDLNIPEDKLEEELQMTKNTPILRDMTSNTLRTGVINMLKTAYANGAINDEKWIKAAEDGSLSMIDLVGLQIHIGAGTKVRDGNNPTIRKQMTSKIKDATDAGILSDPKWAEQAERGTLPIADAMGLLDMINHGKK